MAININNEVSLHYGKEYVLLEDLREFVRETEQMGGKTKVRVRSGGGQRDPFTELKARYGDTAH